MVRTLLLLLLLATGCVLEPEEPRLEPAPTLPPAWELPSDEPVGDDDDATRDPGSLPPEWGDCAQVLERERWCYLFEQGGGASTVRLVDVDDGATCGGLDGVALNPGGSPDLAAAQGSLFGCFGGPVRVDLGTGGLSMLQGPSCVALVPALDHLLVVRASAPMLRAESWQALATGEFTALPTTLSTTHHAVFGDRLLATAADASAALVLDADSGELLDVVDLEGFSGAVHGLEAKDGSLMVLSDGELLRFQTDGSLSDRVAVQDVPAALAWGLACPL